MVEAARAVATAEGIKEATEAGAEDTGEGTADREGRRAAATAAAATINGTRATTTATGGTAVLMTGGGGRALAHAGAGATTGPGGSAAKYSVVTTRKGGEGGRSRLVRELARVRGETNPELHELAYQISGVTAAVHDGEEFFDG